MLLHFLPLQARPTVLLAPSMSASRAAAVSHRRKSTAVSAGIVPQKRVVGAMLTSKDTNVHGMTEQLAVNKENRRVVIYCTLHRMLYLGPIMSSGRTHASNCCSVQ